MAFYSLQRTQIIPVSLEEAWDFFSNPANLDAITPKDMRFVITSKNSNEFYPGQIITYKVSPLFHFPLTWATEIMHINAPHYFADTQLYGPYRFWHHEHHFKKTVSGVEMTDLLYYALPYGILGDLLHALFIRKRIEEIFDYRKRKLEKLWLPLHIKMQG